MSHTTRALNLDFVAPQGEVPDVSELTVRFSEAMVPLGPNPIPDGIRLQPQPAGNWHWVDPQTLVYTAREPFPGATAFTLSIPAGLQALSGAKLPETVTAHFATRWPRVERVEPLGEDLPLQPVFKLVFDSPVNPETALTWVHIADDLALELEPQTHERVLQVRPVAPLAKDTAYTLRVQGVSDARQAGPVQEYPFRTYGPLRLLEDQPTTGRSSQDVLQWRSVRFNNPLSSEGVEVQLRRAEDKGPWHTAPVKISAQTLQIGALGGPHECRILSLRDVFGQSLPESVELLLEFPPALPLLTGQQAITVLHPERPIYRVHHKNVPVYHYKAVAADARNANSLHQTEGVYPGEVLQAGTSTSNELNLSAAVRKSGGQFVLHLLRDNHVQLRCWVQVAGLSLTLLSDGMSNYALVTDSRGRPVAGAQVAAEKTSREGIASVERGTAIAEYQGQTVFVPTPPPRNHPTHQRWYLCSDRPSYRPGETLRVKGWLRNCPVAGGHLLQPACERLEYHLYDRKHTAIVHGTLALTRQGGFDVELQLPETLLLGKAELYFQIPDAGPGDRPGILALQIAHDQNVHAETAVELAQTGECRVSLRHFSGEAIAEGKVELSASFRPRRDTIDGFFFGPDTRPDVFSFESEGETNADGIYQVTLALPTAGFSYDVQWKVRGEHRALHSWHHQETSVWHAARLRVGLRCTRVMVPVGHPVEVDLTVVDEQGRAVAGRAWEIEADPPLRGVSAELPVRVRVPLKTSGAFVVRARVRDDEGKEAASEVMTWALDRTGPLSWLGPRPFRPEQLVLRLAETPRRVGGKGKLLVLSPLCPAQGVMRLVCGGILLLQPFAVTKAQTFVEFEAPPGSIGPVQLRVTVIGANSLADGELTLHFETAAQTLDVQVSATGAFEPGGTVNVEIHVPAPGAEVALACVDAAALAAYPDTFPDPVAALYGGRESMEVTRSSLELLGTAELSLEDLFSFQHPWSRDGMRCSMVAAPPPEPVELRSNFAPCACFFPCLVADSSGRIAVSFRLPDNVTRYRLVAVAVQGDRFGRGESAIIVPRVAALRPNAPTSLRPDDQPVLGVAVADQELSVPLPGTLVQLASAQDAMEFSIPTAAEHPAELYGMSGYLHNERREFVVPPHGHVELLLDSAESLGWIEALSRLPKASATNGDGTIHPLRLQLLAQPLVGGLPLKQLLCVPERSWKERMLRVLDDCTPDGGFGLERWRAKGVEQGSSSYRTVLMLHTALEARQFGLSIDVEHVVNWVQRNVLDRDASTVVTQFEFQQPAAQEALRNAQAYAWFVWKRYGLGILPELPPWFDTELPEETLGWLLLATGHEAVLSRLLSRSHQTAGEMLVREKDRSRVIGSDSMLPLFGRRGQALLFLYFLENRPDDPLTVKLLHGLFSHRFQKHWSHVFDPSHTSVALLEYCRRFEPRLPEFEVQTSLSNEPLLFQGVGQKQVRVAGQPRSPVVIQHRGRGRLYYHVRWHDPAAPVRLQQHSRGFSLTRSYVGPVRADDGWLVASGGSCVSVTMHLHVPRLSAQVQVVERRLPGLQVEEGAPPRDFDGFSVFDDRLEWTAPFLEAGVYTLTYEARLTCRGAFGVPPAYARKTYEPEACGQSSAECLRVT